MVEHTAVLTVVRYPKGLGWAGFLSMAYFRLPLLFSKKLSFYKLMGCGKNGTFDKTPDFRQWCLLVVAGKDNEDTALDDFNYKLFYGKFINGWWTFFKCARWTIVLQPIEGHGKWDGKEAFGDLPRTSDYDGLIGVLTRATIRLSRLKHFWSHVEGVARNMASSQGFITSLGIGEMPWIKQATFSVWENKESMKSFSYKMKEHARVIRKTRQENWYSEEMFVRFKIIASFGSLGTNNPLQGKL